MKKIFVLMLVMMLFLTGCGENEKKAEATAAFNEAVTSFDSVTAILNENLDQVDDETLAIFQEMAGYLTTIKAHFEGDDEVGDEEYDAMIAYFAEVKDWADAAKADLEAAIAADAAAAEAAAAEGTASGDQYASIVGTWTLSGGLTDGVEWEDADLTSVLEMYGGKMDFVFHEDGTVEMIQGAGSLVGTYEQINEEGIGAIFDNNGTELRYICQLLEVEGNVILLVTVDQEDYMYFAYAG